MAKASAKVMLLQDAVAATHPDMTPPTKEMRSNLSVRFCDFAVESNWMIPLKVKAETAPTAETMVLTTALQTSGCESNWIVPELPPLKKSQSQNRMKQPPTIRVSEYG